MFIVEAVLPFLGILIGLVVLHELGHFVLAKLAGVRVEEFGVGFPPRIWGKRFGETLYSINWLPLGGFVRLTGEESARVFVRTVNAYSPAARADIRAGDVIKQVNGAPVHSEEQFAARLAASAADGTIALTIEREATTAAGSELREHEALLDLPAAAPDPTAATGAAAAVGESPAAIVGRLAGVAVSPDPRSLGSKPRPVRILILAAGAGVNAILPILLFASAALIPQTVPAGPALITSVIQGGPAAAAGLQPGDRVLRINDEEIRNHVDISLQIQLHLGEDLDFVVERDVPLEGTTQRPTSERAIVETTVHARLAPDPLQHVVQPGETVHDVAALLGVTASQVLAGAGLGGGVELPADLTLILPGGEIYVTQPGDTAVAVARDLGLRTETVLRAAEIDLVNLTPGSEIEVPQGPTGISIANGSRATVTESDGFFAAVASGWERTTDALILLRNRIRSWLAGGEGLRFSGPIGIARATGEVVEAAGWLRLIELAALLSLWLAIVNILPLPMLDGGRIVFVLLEIVRRGKRISPEKEGLVHLAGFVLIITMAVIISYFDIVRAVSGESALR